MARPNFCPNCGQPVPDDRNSAQGFSLGETGETGWDCYCAYCHWSGDILPDDEIPVTISEEA